MTVSKKKFRKAVDRNLVRRRMREAYRLNKNDLYSVLLQQQVSIDLAVVYTGDHLPSFEEISENMLLLIKRLVSYYEKTS